MEEEIKCEENICKVVRRVAYVKDYMELGFGENAFTTEKGKLTKIHRDKEGDKGKGWKEEFWYSENY